MIKIARLCVYGREGLSFYFDAGQENCNLWENDGKKLAVCAHSVYFCTRKDYRYNNLKGNNYDYFKLCSITVGCCSEEHHADYHQEIKWSPPPLLPKGGWEAYL